MDKVETNFFSITLILSASLISLQAILWVYWGSPWLLGFLANRGINSMLIEELLSRNRAFIPFILPATLGGYLIMHIPLGVALFLQHYKDVSIPLWIRPPKNLLLLGSIVVMLIALVLTKSIGPITSFLLSVLIVLFLHKSTEQKTLRLIIGVLSIILFIFIFMRSYNVGYWRNPLYSSLQRQFYWINTLAVIQAHPLWGIGPGNMPFVGSWFSHNSYLQLWAESGIFAFLSFCNLIFYVFSKDIKTKAFLRPQLSWLTISVLAFLIHNLIDFTFFLPETAVPWWGIFAIFCKETKYLTA